MTRSRIVPLVLAIATAGALAACTTPAAMPMGAAAAGSMAHHESMARMDEQMKTMMAMHEKMTSAKTPAERSALMHEHMKAMQGGMDMMKGMPPGMGAKAMPAMGDMEAHHKMMAKHMEMMQAMMGMMHSHMMASMPAK